jgi:hypothetical protein
MAMIEVREQKRQEAEDRRRAQEKADRKELLALIAPIAGSVITALLSRPGSPATDLPALITALRPTVAPNPTAGMKDMMEMLTMMKDLTGDGGGSETAEILKSVTGLAGPVLTALAQPRAPAPPRVSSPTPPGAPLRVQGNPVATVPSAGPPPAQPVVLPMDTPSRPHTNPATVAGVDLQAPSLPPLNQEQQTMFAELKLQVDALVQIAAGGADPVVVADTFFEQQMLAFDENAYGSFTEFLENPQFLQRIAIFNRDVMTHKDFFEAMRTRIMQRVKEESELAQASLPKAVRP